MLFIDRSLALVRAFKKDGMLSGRRLARMAGLSENTIRRIDDPEWSPEADTLRALESLVPEGFAPKTEDPPRAEEPALAEPRAGAAE